MLDSRISRIGDEMGEMEEFLSNMKEERKYHLQRCGANRRAVQEREAEKERSGLAICAQAMSRRETSSPEATDCRGMDTTPARMPCKRSHGTAFKDPFVNDTKTFSDALKTGYEA